MNSVPFSNLTNKVIIKVVGGERNSDILRIYCNDGSAYEMLHHQDCCESVYIEDIEGDWEDIIGYAITNAEEVIHDGNTLTTDDKFHLSSLESYTWTFYKIDTRKGGITLRWLGSSNGYYSETVNFYQTTTGIMDI